MKHHYLKSYRNRLWDLFENFEVLHIQSFPKKFNSKVDALAQMGASFDPINDWFWRKGFQLIFRPSILKTLDLDYFREQDVIQLNNNTIPKNLIPFEGLFHRKD